MDGLRYVRDSLNIDGLVYHSADLLWEGGVEKEVVDVPPSGTICDQPDEH